MCASETRLWLQAQAHLFYVKKGTFKLGLKDLEKKFLLRVLCQLLRLQFDLRFLYVSLAKVQYSLCYR